MQHLWPPPAAPGRELDHRGLAALYAYPEPCPAPFLRLNFVASADGAVSVDGVSGGLDAPGDATVFGLLRELADVVLVGAGTVRAEGYRGVRTSPQRRARRRGRGRAEVPPVAVVTTRCDLDPASALFTDTAVGPLVLTAADAPGHARRRLADAGAEVVPASTPAAPGAVDPAVAVDALAVRGLARVLCEGGPTLFGSLATAGLVDELCLSVAPTLVGPGPGRIVAGAGLAVDGHEAHDGLRLASVLAHADGLMLRYRTPRGDRADPAGAREGTDASPTTDAPGVTPFG